MSGRLFKDYEVAQFEFNKNLEFEQIEEMEEKLLSQYQEKRRQFIAFRKQLEMLEHSNDSKKLLLYVKYIFDKVEDSDCGNYCEVFSDNSLYFLNKSTMEIFSCVFHCPDADCKDCFTRTTLKFCLRDFPPSEWRDRLKL